MLFERDLLDVALEHVKDIQRVGVRRHLFFLGAGPVSRNCRQTPYGQDCSGEIVKLVCLLQSQVGGVAGDGEPARLFKDQQCRGNVPDVRSGFPIDVGRPLGDKAQVERSGTQTTNASTTKASLLRRNSKLVHRCRLGLQRRSVPHPAKLADDQAVARGFDHGGCGVENGQPLCPVEVRPLPHLCGEQLEGELGLPESYLIKNGIEHNPHHGLLLDKDSDRDAHKRESTLLSLCSLTAYL